jgi:hypothetical protein
MPDRWPAAMRLSTAAAYLDMKSTKAIEDAIRRGDLCPVQATERGDRMILREDLDFWLRSLQTRKVVSQK